MVFNNPSGAPELACDECGCRWFDRMSNACYECGAQVTPEARAEFERALAEFHMRAHPGEASPAAVPGKEVDAA